MATKLKLAQQAQMLLGYKPSIQEMILATNQAYAYVVRTNWWANKNQGENDINGNFIYAFKDNDILLDADVNLYYSVLPSTFLGNIPYEMGIPHVSYMQSLNKPFIRLSNGMPALFEGLQSSNFSGYDNFFVENNRIYLPSIDTSTACTSKLLIKLVVALEGLDEQTEISIPPDLQYDIVQLAVKMYSQQQNDSVVESLPVDKGQKP
jgi:hypothetical protein